MILVPYAAAFIVALGWVATMVCCLRPIRRAQKARRLARRRVRLRHAAAPATGRLCPTCGYDMDGHPDPDPILTDPLLPGAPRPAAASPRRGLVQGNRLAAAVAREKFDGALHQCPECGETPDSVREYYRPRSLETLASAATAILIPMRAGENPDMRAIGPRPRPAPIE